MKLALVLLVALGCAANTRHKTIAASLVAVDTATTAFLAFDGQHEIDIAHNAPDRPTVESQIAAWHTERAKVNEMIRVAVKAIAAAATVDDDPTVAGAVSAVGILASELAKLGVKVP